MELTQQQEVEWVAQIEKAAEIAMKKEFKLLQIGKVERNFTVSFANAISKEIIIGADIHVDPFYNKHFDAAKKLNGGVIELDIAIHERYVDTQNLIAIEMETTNSPKRDDVWKIEGLTSPLGGFGYKLGLYIVFGVKKKAGKIISMEWFKAGKAF
jgi:hypothetical protein